MAAPGYWGRGVTGINTDLDRHLKYVSRILSGNKYFRGCLKVVSICNNQWRSWDFTLRDINARIFLEPNHHPSI